MTARRKPYWKRVALAFDQFWNAAAGGHEDETISSAIGRKAVAGVRWALVAEKAIDLFLGAGHCRRAIGE